MSRFFCVCLREKAWEGKRQTQSYIFLKLPEVTSSFCCLPHSHWLLRGWPRWWTDSSLSLVSLLLTGDIFGLRIRLKREHNKIGFKTLLPLYGVYLKAHDRTKHETRPLRLGLRMLIVWSQSVTSRLIAFINVKAADSARWHCALCTVNIIFICTASTISIWNRWLEHSIYTWSNCINLATAPTFLDDLKGNITIF